jgi:hypothetical protein
MPQLIKIAPLLVLAGLLAQERFDPGPVTQYPARQSSNQVTVAVEPYRDRDKVRKVFGRTDFEKLGVVPLLVVIANDSDEVLRADEIRVQLITADRQRIDSLAADDVLRSGGIERPEMTPRPSPIPGLGRRKPRDSPEIAQREFAAPVVPAHGVEHGFFYFRMGKGPDRLAGSTAYITGIKEAKTGQELVYFEIPLAGAARK